MVMLTFSRQMGSSKILNEYTFQNDSGAEVIWVLTSSCERPFQGTWKPKRSSQVATVSSLFGPIIHHQPSSCHFSSQRFLDLGLENPGRTLVSGSPACWSFSSQLIWKFWQRQLSRAVLTLPSSKSAPA